MNLLKIFFLSIILCLPTIIFSQMSSFNYLISKDSINSFGTENSSSSNYFLSDSGGQLVSGISSGTHNIVNSGFRQRDNYFLELSCDSNNLNLSPLQITGKSNLNNNFLNCIVRTNNPSGYIFQVLTTEQKIINVSDSNFFVNSIPNITPNYWPTSFSDGKGWGIHLGNESDNYSSTLWGISNDYQSNGGKWIGLINNQSSTLITRNNPTDDDGDRERIYFGFEISPDSILAEGDYRTNIDFIVVPSF